MSVPASIRIPIISALHSLTAVKNALELGVPPPGLRVAADVVGFEVGSGVGSAVGTNVAVGMSVAVGYGVAEGYGVDVGNGAGVYVGCGV